MADDLVDKDLGRKDGGEIDKSQNVNDPKSQERGADSLPEATKQLTLNGNTSEGASQSSADSDSETDGFREGVVFPVVELLDRGVDTASDVAGEVALSVEKIGKTFLSLVSVEDEPENNVHFVHPVTGDAVALGLHIEEHEYGCVATAVTEDGYASKFKIEKGDIIRKINGTDLQGFKLEEMIKLLSGVDLAKEINLRVVRIQKNDEGKNYLNVMDITIKIKISEDKIGFDFEAIVTATFVRFQNRSNKKFIRQGPHDASTVYLRVNDDNEAHISTVVDENCHFVMELYQGDPFARICVIRHHESALVIHKTAGVELGARAAPDANPSSVLSDLDHKFFYWVTPSLYPGEDVFRSVSNRGSYMAVGPNNTLCLKSFNSIGEVDSTARFIVQDVAP